MTEIVVRIPAGPRELEAARQRARRLVTRRALASAGIVLVPIPGVDIAADVGLLIKLIPEINAAFGLTPEQIERLNPKRRLAVYKAIVAFGGAMVGRVVTREMVLAALKLVGVRLTARTATRFVPIAGQAAAAALSYAAMRYVGEQHIRDCMRVVDAVIAADAVQAEA